MQKCCEMKAKEMMQGPGTSYEPFHSCKAPWEENTTTHLQFISLSLSLFNRKDTLNSFIQDSLRFLLPAYKNTL